MKNHASTIFSFSIGSFGILLYISIKVSFFWFIENLWSEILRWTSWVNGSMLKLKLKQEFQYFLCRILNLNFVLNRSKGSILCNSESFIVFFSVLLGRRGKSIKLIFILHVYSNFRSGRATKWKLENGPRRRRLNNHWHCIVKMNRVRCLWQSTFWHSRF